MAVSLSRRPLRPVPNQSDVDSSCAESFQKLSIKLQYTSEPSAEIQDLWSGSELNKLVKTIQHFKYRGRTTDEENIWDDAAKKLRWRGFKRSGFECKMVWNRTLEAWSEVDEAYLAKQEWIQAGLAQSWASLEAWEERKAAMAAAAGNKD